MFILEFASLIGIVFFVLYGLKNHIIKSFVYQGLMAFWAYFALFFTSLKFVYANLEPLQVALIFYFIVISLSLGISFLLKNFIEGLIANIASRHKNGTKQLLIASSLVISIAFGGLFCVINVCFISKFFKGTSALNQSPLVHFLKESNAFGAFNDYKKDARQDNLALFIVSDNFAKELNLNQNHKDTLNAMWLYAPAFDLKDVEAYHRQHQDSKKTALHFIKLYIKSYPAINSAKAVERSYAEALQNFLLHGPQYAGSQNQQDDKTEDSVKLLVEEELKKENDLKLRQISAKSNNSVKDNKDEDSEIANIIASNITKPVKGGNLKETDPLGEIISQSNNVFNASNHQDANLARVNTQSDVDEIGNILQSDTLDANN